MTDIIVYKCPACGGRMEFDSKTQHMKCPFCDTQHEEGVLMTDEEIMAEVGKYPAMMVILTGGEPSLWIDREFVDRLHQLGKYVCIETNGTHELPDNRLGDLLAQTRGKTEHFPHG